MSVPLLYHYRKNLFRGFELVVHTTVAGRDLLHFFATGGAKSWSERYKVVNEEISLHWASFESEQPQIMHSSTMIDHGQNTVAS